MGMFDSLYTDCPNCGEELEFQSKSGECFLTSYNKEFPLSAQVAVGMDGDIVRCQFCNKRIMLECNLPLSIKFKLIITKGRRFDYEGNFKPEHPYTPKPSKFTEKLEGEVKIKNWVLVTHKGIWKLDSTKLDVSEDELALCIEEQIWGLNDR